MKVLIIEGMHESGIRLLRRNGIKTVAVRDVYQNDEIDILIVRSVFRVSEKTLNEFPNLRIVAKLGTGLDNIDQNLCHRHNIKIFSAPAMNAVSTAEFTVMQILNIYKNSSAIYENVKNRDFRRSLFYGREISGLTASIMGYGSVGKNIAARLKPFVKEIYICEKNQQCDVQVGTMRFVSDIYGVLPVSDIVILALSLKNNERIINKDFLSKVKRSALIANIARGALIDKQALSDFLKTNKRALYYCDILEDEPDYHKPPEEQDYQNPLLELPNVFFTPHIAGMTEESQKMIALHVSRKIIEDSKQFTRKKKMTYAY